MHVAGGGVLPGTVFVAKDVLVRVIRHAGEAAGTPDCSRWPSLVFARMDDPQGSGSKGYEWGMGSDVPAAVGRGQVFESFGESKRETLRVKTDTGRCFRRSRNGISPRSSEISLRRWVREREIAALRTDSQERNVLSSFAWADSSIEAHSKRGAPPHSNHCLSQSRS